jgi:hypothetical protein
LTFFGELRSDLSAAFWDFYYVRPIINIFLVLKIIAPQYGRYSTVNAGISTRSDDDRYAFNLKLFAGQAIGADTRSSSDETMVPAIQLGDIGFLCRIPIQTFGLGCREERLLDFEKSIQ